MDLCRSDPIDTPQRRHAASGTSPALYFRCCGHWRLVTAERKAPRSSLVQPGDFTEGSRMRASGRQQGPREGWPGEGCSCGNFFYRRAQRHCQTASFTRAATLAGESLVNAISIPSWVTKVSPSRKRQPSRAMVAAVAVAGPQTAAHGRFADASF